MEYRESCEARILDASIDPAFVVDPDGILLYWNRALPTHLGVRPKRLEEDRRCGEWLNLFGLKRTLSTVEKEGRTIRLREVHCTLPDGSACSVFLSVSPLFRDDGSYRGALVFLKDLTGEEQVHRKYRRLWERERNARTHLARLTRDLRSSNRKVKLLNTTLLTQVRRGSNSLDSLIGEMRGIGKEKEEYLSSVSHELRSPITSIQSMSEVLLKYRNLDPEKYEEFVEIINSESRRLSRLVDDILDMSSMDAGSFRPDVSEIDVGCLVRAAIRPLHSQAERKKIRLSIEIDRSIPSMESDADRITQVLTNLVTNAMKFTSDGGRIKVSAAYVASSDAVCFTVADNGIGIPAEEIPLLFDRYHQVGRGKGDGKREKGTGLGLSISKMIVENLGGVIWVESEPGKGSVFSFRLPCHASCEASRAAAHAPV